MLVSIMLATRDGKWPIDGRGSLEICGRRNLRVRFPECFAYQQFQKQNNHWFREKEKEKYVGEEACGGVRTCQLHGSKQRGAK